jgi:hypothetical protein
MRYAAAAVLITLVSTAAFSNPGPGEDALYFDAGGGTNCIWPPVGSEFTVTVLLGDLSSTTEEGIVEISFRFDRTFSGVQLSQTSLLYGPESGDVEGAGWTCATGGECAGPSPQGFIPIAQVEYLYLGVPGVILPAAHNEHGTSLINCFDEPWFWNLYDVPVGGELGVGMEPPGGCLQGTPVADVSWGAVKALYR